MDVWILVEEISIVVTGGVKNIMWEWPRRIIKSHTITYKIAIYILRIPVIYRIFHRLEVERELHSRIGHLNHDEYLDYLHE